MHDEKTLIAAALASLEAVVTHVNYDVIQRTYAAQVAVGTSRTTYIVPILDAAIDKQLQAEQTPQTLATEQERCPHCDHTDKQTSIKFCRHNACVCTHEWHEFSTEDEERHE